MRQLFFTHMLISFFICKSAISQQFGTRVDMGIIESNEIVEVSGIAASSKNPGVLWTHNDSGGKSRVFAFDSHGRHLGNFFLAGAQNRDWEDIAIGPGPIAGEQYIYIGNIGDNSVRYDEKYIYRIIEPLVSIGQAPIDTVLYDVDRLVFQYPDGNRNAETLMIDPLNLDIYIVSKELNTKVYRAAWPYTFYAAPTLHVDTLEVVTSLPFSTAVGGDISPDGKEILIKKSNVMYYWYKNDDQTIGEALGGNPKVVPYFKEPQGEAVCWASDLSGYYTISEGSHPHLYFYPRIYNTVVLQGKSNPEKFKLNQNYPNPFNPTTTISYQLPESSHINLSIYNINGYLIDTLVNGYRNAGYYSVEWDARGLSSGVYFYRINAGEYSSVRKCAILK